MTSDLETLTTTLNVLSNEIKNHTVGSTPIGIHLEGPFISQVYKGAQGESFIQVPSIDTFIKLNKASNNLIKKVTLAPECDPNMELIKYLSKHNIVSSIGHSNATYDICKIAIENGVKSFTHGYNAMSKLHHRDIGCVGEMLLDDNVYVELICDLLHVSEPAIQLLYKCKKDKIILVTDSMRAKNQGDCISELGGQEVIVKDGKATLKDNTLAGSVLKADVAFRNYIKTTNCSIRQAIKATSTNVVKLHNLKNKGFIEKGYDSDFILMDKDLNIVNTFCLGVKY
jgi:N-acetylglucosamine-6-phosphate deacetylase